MGIRAILAGLLFGVASVAAAEEGILPFLIVDEQGYPVEDALVTWKAYRDGLELEFPGEHETAYTNANGEVSIDFREHHRFEEHNFSIRVVDTQDRVGYTRVYPPRGWDEVTTIELGRRELVKGYVKDAQGNPIEDVIIGTTWFPYAMTDANGYFQVHGVGESGGTFSFYKEGYGWHRESTSTLNLNVTLYPGVIVHFNAKDENELPLEGVQIRYNDNLVSTDAQGDAASIPIAPGTRLYAQAFHDVPPKHYSGTIVAVREIPTEAQRSRPKFVEYEVPAVFEGREPGIIYQPIRLSSYDTEMDFSMKRRDVESGNTRLVAGRVLSLETGDPVEARLYLNSDTQNMHWGDKENTSPQDGTFLFEHVLAGKWYILARPKNPVLYSKDWIRILDLSDKSMEDLTLTVDTGWAISGRLIQADSPVEFNRTYVYADLSEERRWETYSPAKSGEYIVPNIPADIEQVKLTFVQDPHREEVIVRRPELGTIVENIDYQYLAERDKAHIVGVVVDTSGFPCSGVRVDFREIKGPNEPTQFLHSEKTDIDGRFSVETWKTGDFGISDVHFFVRTGPSSNRGVQAELQQSPDRVSVRRGAQITDLRIVIRPPEGVLIR